MPAVILRKKPLYFSCKKKLWNGKFTDYGKGLDIKMRNRNYFNNNNMQKGIALATCMAIVMGLFTGCGNKNDQQIAASPDEVQKGRYVETELALPEEWKDKNISQIFRSGDELHFLVAGGSEGHFRGMEAGRRRYSDGSDEGLAEGASRGKGSGEQ